MATLLNTQKAPLLLNGEPVTQGQIASSHPSVASIVMQPASPNPVCYVVAQNAGTATITLTLGSWQGTLEVSVSEAMVLTLGTPEPK